MGSNGAFYFWLAFTTPNKVYSDFLCARLDKLNEKALNDRPRSIDEWPLRPPLLSGRPFHKVAHQLERAGSQMSRFLCLLVPLSSSDHWPPNEADILENNVLWASGKK